MVMVVVVVVMVILHGDGDLVVLGRWCSLARLVVVGDGGRCW